MKNIFVFIVIAFFNINLFAGEKNMSLKFKNLDQYLEQITTFDKGMGDVTILSHGEFVYSNHFGAQEKKESIYRIGSISKIYTAVIIMRLIEDGYLTLETKLSKFYPDIDQADKITIEHLLRHRSGLPNFTDDPDYFNYFENPITELEQYNRLKKYKLEFSPNEKYKYSNTGYELLSYVAQKASSFSYEKLLAKYITLPLKLNNTYVYSKSHPRTNEVKSYKKGMTWILSTNTHETVSIGAGSISSTAKEVALFLRALFKGELVSQNTLIQMINLKDGYGLGLIDFPYRKKQFFGHNGAIDGFRSIAGFEPEGDLIFVQLMNKVAVNFNDVSIAILSSFYGDPLNFPAYKENVIVPVEILNRYEGTYSTDKLPLKLMFHQKGGNFFGQATGEGQGEILFEANSMQDFFNSATEITLKFSPDGKILNFHQGQSFEFKKE